MYYDKAFEQMQKMGGARVAAVAEPTKVDCLNDLHYKYVAALPLCLRRCAHGHPRRSFPQDQGAVTAEWEVRRAQCCCCCCCSPHPQRFYGKGKRSVQ